MHLTGMLALIGLFAEHSGNRTQTQLMRVTLSFLCVELQERPSAGCALALAESPHPAQTERCLISPSHCDANGPVLLSTHWYSHSVYMWISDFSKQGCNYIQNESMDVKIRMA